MSIRVVISSTSSPILASNVRPSGVAENPVMSRSRSARLSYRNRYVISEDRPTVATQGPAVWNPLALRTPRPCLVI